MPAELVDVIGRAQMIIHWQENMLSKDMPPRWMWPLDDELNAHFERLHLRSPDDSDDDREPIGGAMLQNEYARNRGRNLRSD